MFGTRNAPTKWALIFSLFTNLARFVNKFTSNITVNLTGDPKNNLLLTHIYATSKLNLNRLGRKSKLISHGIHWRRKIVESE